MQLDLFAWADSRPSAVILDARQRLNAKMVPYILDMPEWSDIQRNPKADVVPLRPERGAA